MAGAEPHPRVLAPDDVVAVWTYEILRGNGAVTDFGFDTAQRLTALVHDLPGSADDQSYGFSYTPASQVWTQTASHAGYAWAAPAVSGRTYERNGLNQYTSVAGLNFLHDARGNLIDDGSRTLAYDLENRLLSVSGPASLNLSYFSRADKHSNIGAYAI